MDENEKFKDDRTTKNINIPPDRDLTPAEIERAIQEQEGVEVRFPSGNRIKEYRPWVDEIIKDLGLSSTFVSDPSTLGDFAFLEDKDIVELGEKWGFPVKREDYIWEIAKKLKESVHN